MNTKQIITIVFLLINIFSLQSQSVLSEGTEWHYNLYEFWQPGFGHNRCYIEGDTVINQKECYIYKRTETTCDLRPMVEYVYEEDEKLYYYETTLDRFLILYDYGVDSGDTIALEYWPNFSSDSLFYIRVDSTDYIQYDTLELKRFYITYDTWDDTEIVFLEQNNDKGIIIEGIGSMFNYFHFDEPGFCDGDYNIGLRCFNNPTYELIQFTDIACDSVTSTSSILEDQYIEISPNPFIDHVSIKSTIEIRDAVVIVYDIMGTELIRKKMDGKEKLDEVLDVSNFPESVYILNIYEYDKSMKLRFSTKIVKLK